jgi:hypothetical protein
MRAFRLTAELQSWLRGGDECGLNHSHMCVGTSPSHVGVDYHAVLIRDSRSLGLLDAATGATHYYAPRSAQVTPRSLEFV